MYFKQMDELAAPEVPTACSPNAEKRPKAHLLEDNERNVAVLVEMDVNETLNGRRKCGP